MSDTLRSYSGSKGGLTFSKSRGSRSGLIPAIFLVLLAMVAVAAFWISRDTHDIEEFLPANQPVQVRVEQAITSRATLAESPVWAVLPSEAAKDLRASLQDPLPVPEWLAKNLLNRELYWFGDAESGEGVLVSRMTRAGTIAARLGLLMPSIDRDWAGGLYLSTLPEEGVYFAVRGRILIASASRRGVIESLTLADDERAMLEGYLAEPPENTQIAGVTTLSDDLATRLGVDRVEFGVVSEPSRFGVIARGTLADGHSPLGALFAGSRPSTLHAPAAAPAAVVVNLDAPLRDVSIALGEAAGTNWPDAAQWEEWSIPPDDERDRPAMGELLAGLGPELHVTLHDVDPYEVLPVPEIVVWNPNPPAGLADRVASFPAPAPGPSIASVRASYDSETGVVRIPAPGGDSLEPSGAFHGDRFVFSTSLARLNTILSGAKATESLPGANNAYVRIQPNRVLDTLGTAGGVLAENGLLEGHNPESFKRQIAEWRDQFKTIDSVEAVLRTADGDVILECEMRFVAP